MRDVDSVVRLVLTRVALPTYSVASQNSFQPSLYVSLHNTCTDHPGCHLRSRHTSNGCDNNIGLGKLPHTRISSEGNDTVPAPLATRPPGPRPTLDRPSGRVASASTGSHATYPTATTVLDGPPGPARGAPATSIGLGKRIWALDPDVRRSSLARRRHTNSYKITPSPRCVRPAHTTDVRRREHRPLSPCPCLSFLVTRAMRSYLRRSFWLAFSCCFPRRRRLCRARANICGLPSHFGPYCRKRTCDTIWLSRHERTWSGSGDRLRKTLSRA